MAAITLSCTSPKSVDPQTFCDALRDVSAATGSVSSADLDKSDTIQVAISELEMLATIAPSEIAPDMTMLSDIYSEVLNILASTAPDARNNALRDLQERLDQGRAPAVALERYASRSCGIEFEGLPEPTPTTIPQEIDD